jgi:hypothetical protein
MVAMTFFWVIPFSALHGLRKRLRIHYRHSWRRHGQTATHAVEIRQITETRDLVELLHTRTGGFCRSRQQVPVFSRAQYGRGTGCSKQGA